MEGGRVSLLLVELEVELACLCFCFWASVEGFGSGDDVGEISLSHASTLDVGLESCCGRLG